MKISPGKPNAISHITLIKSMDKKALFKISPVTGKKHQLRIHLSGLGFPILNDRVYPELLEEKTPDFSAPLQLLAEKIRFKDPLSGRNVSYTSERRLACQD
jgi:tRNA pseudouridine32 synthase/23S rRNA pseudouridine746 synthase